MITKKCSDCGNEFTLTDGEIEFYRSKGLHLPNRCKSCRDKRKGSKAPSAPQNNSRGKRSLPPIPVIIILAIVLLLAFIFGHSDTTDISEPAVSPEITVTSSYDTEETVAENRTSDTYPETSFSADVIETTSSSETQKLHFRSDALLTEHYEKHGIEMGFASAAEYEAAAAAVVNSPEALHKLEKEDNDDVYYLESTNEFVIVSTDGYIRTFFSPDSGKDYFDRQ